MIRDADPTALLSAIGTLPPVLVVILWIGFLGVVGLVAVLASLALLDLGGRVIVQAHARRLDRRAERHAADWLDRPDAIDTIRRLDAAGFVTPGSPNAQARRPYDGAPGTPADDRPDRATVGL